MSMIKQRFERILSKRCTLLGVGPMSVNCIDATIELANEHDVPLMLIASRRQIDSKDFGGGYVNNWDTASFADYVIEHDKSGKVYLARDHGGPWQNPCEIDGKLSLRRAMESAKKSYKADIEAGFQIIHIDPSVDIFGHPNVDEILDRVFELYDFCWSHAQRLNQKVLFEIGTEEQTGSTNKQEEMDYSINAIQNFCKKNKIDSPLFVVVQTGTRVMETRNIGSFDSPIRVADEIPPEIQVPKMVELCRKHGVFMKAHNSDYLSDQALQWHPRIGIHAANVAPEFGVAETIALLSVLEKNGLSNLSNTFLQIAFESNKWRKWVLKDSKTTDREKAIIAGHYIFSKEEIVLLKSEASMHLKRKGVNLDEFLKNEIKKSIFRYLKNFRLVRNI